MTFFSLRRDEPPPPNWRQLFWKKGKFITRVNMVLPHKNPNTWQTGVKLITATWKTTEGSAAKTSFHTNFIQSRFLQTGSGHRGDISLNLVARHEKQTTTLTALLNTAVRMRKTWMTTIIMGSLSPMLYIAILLLWPCQVIVQCKILLSVCILFSGHERSQFMFRETRKQGSQIPLHSLSLMRGHVVLDLRVRSNHLVLDLRVTDNSGTFVIETERPKSAQVKTFIQGNRGRHILRKMHNALFPFQ